MDTLEDRIERHVRSMLPMCAVCHSTTRSLDFHTTKVVGTSFDDAHYSKDLVEIEQVLVSCMNCGHTLTFSKDRLTWNLPAEEEYYE